METQKSIFKILLAFLIISVLAFIVSLNWMGCKTEEIVNTGPPPVIDATLLGGRVVLADYMGDSIPLYNVKVEVINGPTFYTDSNGTYWLTNVSYGKHTVKYSKEGYTSFFTEIDTANFRTGIPQIFLGKLNAGVSIGPGGGIVQNNKMTLIIPPGALKNVTQISLSSMPVTKSYISDFVPLDAVTILPSGVRFYSPVKLSMPTPLLYQNADSIPMKLYSLDFTNYNWSDNSASVYLSHDSIRVNFSNYSDNTNITISDPGVIGLVGYIEITMGAWHPPLQYFQYASYPMTGCVGYGSMPGAIAASTYTLSKSITASIGFSNFITGAIGGVIGYTTSITLPAVTIPICNCISFTNTILKGQSYAFVSVKHCFQIPFHYPPTCTNSYTFTVYSEEFKGIQSAVTSVHNNIPQCHNQGGN